jgi:hypothetical protein
MYNITPYTYKKAKQLGVFVRPSVKKGKKIDIYDNDGEYITSVGGYGFLDYGNYLIERGKEYADKRRALYKMRHRKDLNVKYSNGWWADNLLW